MIANPFYSLYVLNSPRKLVARSGWLRRGRPVVGAATLESSRENASWRGEVRRCVASLRQLVAVGRSCGQLRSVLVPSRCLVVLPTSLPRAKSGERRWNSARKANTVRAIRANKKRRGISDRHVVVDRRWCERRQEPRGNTVRASFRRRNRNGRGSVAQDEHSSEEGADSSAGEHDHTYTHT